jgi:LacI family transcriptional regulator
MTQRPTLSQIARHCGINKSTVSRVLNNRCDEGFSVKPELRDKILRVARQLNYRPNLAGRSLANRQSKLIVIPRLMPKGDGQYVPGIYDSVTSHLVKALKEHGFETCCTFYDPQEDATLLPPWSADGLVVMHRAPTHMIEELEQIQMPYVCVNCLPGPSGGSVQIDDRHGVNLAMEHLLELGHCRIAYRRFRTHLAPLHSSIIERHEAYLDFLNDHGLKPIAPHDGPWDEPVKYLQKIIKAKATAVLVYDHVEAIRLLNASELAGVRFPDDLSLVCFNDEFPGSLVMPKLTAVAMPTKAMGQQAAQQIIGMVTGKTATPIPVSMVKPDTLVARQSAIALES